ncbi:MAG: cobalamin-dependent protein [Anaerolineae bacterium]
MTQVLLGQSYYLRFDAKLYAAMQPYPPLGTLYAASLLREQGYAVALFDAMLAENTQAWAAALDQHKPRYAVLFEDNFNYLSKMSLLRMRQAAFEMIDAAKARGCTVICGGADETDHAELYLQRRADYVVTGEGDRTLVELIDHLEGKSELPLDQIRSLAYRDHDGKIVKTLPRPVIAKLDALPFPAWDLVDHAAYHAVWKTHHGYIDEHGDDARLSVPLQLVRQTDLGTALQRQVAAECRRRDGVDQGAV